MTRVEQARAEVEAVLKNNHEMKHRALDRHYNLLRVSERRWAVVRVASVAATLFEHQDVITFEQVTKPLSFDEARAQLGHYRAKAGARPEVQS